MSKELIVKAVCEKCGMEYNITKSIDKKKFYKKYPLAKKAGTEVTLVCKQCKNCKEEQ